MEFPRQVRKCLDIYLLALGMFSWHSTYNLRLLHFCCVALSLGKILDSRERHSEFAFCRELRTEFNNFVTFGFALNMKSPGSEKEAEFILAVLSYINNTNYTRNEVTMPSLSLEFVFVCLKCDVRMSY